MRTNNDILNRMAFMGVPQGTPEERKETRTVNVKITVTRQYDIYPSDDLETLIKRDGFTDFDYEIV